MTDFIEADALKDTTHATPPIRDHPVHKETVKSFVATPIVEEGLLQRFRSWLSGDTPNTPMVYKSASGLRRMLLFTSNSYQDRDGETITSKALEEYEASCYPGEDLYHNDNPFLWWHDDEIVMGSLVSVEYIPPFLMEVAEELPNDPVSKALWDFAEANGDKAGVSHRFGYLGKDRDDDGTFHRIFKQETSYLPERNLAANGKTYAGVLKPMSIPESRKRMGEILKETTQVDGIEELLHTEGVPAVRKRLAEQGLAHKAFPPVAAKKPVVEAETVVADEAVVEADADVMDDETEEMDAPPVADTPSTMDDLKRMAIVMDSLFNMVQTIIDESAASELDRSSMFKELKELKEMRVSEKAQEKTTLDLLEEKLKALEGRVNTAEKKLELTPRSVSQSVASADPELAKRIVSDAIDGAEKAKAEEALTVDPFWGPVKPLPK